MATITRGKTFISGETVEPADMHQLVDSATVTNIVNADIASNAAIAASKLALTGAISDTQLATGAVTGAAGGGKLAASAITGQTQKASIADADELLVHSDSDSALRRVAWSVMQPAGTVVGTDYVQLVDDQSYSGNNLAESSTAFAITDGHELLSKAYSCSSVSNHIILTVSAQIGGSAGTRGVVGVFADNTLIAARPTGVQYEAHTNIVFKHSPATTSSVAYSVRAAVISGTLYANRMYFYNPYDTGLTVSSLLIQEIKG